MGSTLKKSARNLIAAFKKILPAHSRYQKFVILGHARTGSNFLLNGLYQVKSVKMYDEEFAGHKRVIGVGYDSIIGKIFGPVEFYIKHVGFKLFYYHLTSEELTKLRAIDGMKVIHLMRENKLRTIVSLDKAKQNNAWMSDGKKKSEPVTLDVDSLPERITKIVRYEEEFGQLFANHQLLTIKYERLIEDPEEIFQKVSDFLNIEGINPHKIGLKKQGESTLSSDVTNAQAVSIALANTSYQIYLDTY